MCTLFRFYFVILFSSSASSSKREKKEKKERKKLFHGKYDSGVGEHEKWKTVAPQTFPAWLKIFPTVLKLNTNTAFPGSEEERINCVLACTIVRVAEKNRWTVEVNRWKGESVDETAIGKGTYADRDGQKHRFCCQQIHKRNQSKEKERYVKIVFFRTNHGTTDGLKQKRLKISEKSCL